MSRVMLALLVALLALGAGGGPMTAFGPALSTGTTLTGHNAPAGVAAAKPRLETDRTHAAKSKKTKTKKTITNVDPGAVLAGGPPAAGGCF